MLALATLLVMLEVAPAAAQPGRGDPAAGRLIALKSCASCHAASAREIWYSQYARSFLEIARDPALGGDELRDFIGRTHRMFWPGVALTPQEAADVIAYIRASSARNASRKRLGRAACQICFIIRTDEPPSGGRSWPWSKQAQRTGKRWLGLSRRGSSGVPARGHCEPWRGLDLCAS